MQKQGFSFEPAQPEDMEAVFGLIDARIQWMEERGIDQWAVRTQTLPQRLEDAVFGKSGGS